MNPETQAKIQSLFLETYKEKLEKITGVELSLSFTYDDTYRYYVVGLMGPSVNNFGIKSPQIIARGYLTPFAGCCGLIISHNGGVFRHQRKGVGTIMNQIRIDICRILGYGTAICTDVDTNAPQNRLLDKNGWTKVHQFKNPRTTHLVNIHVVEVCKWS